MLHRGYEETDGVEILGSLRRVESARAFERRVGESRYTVELALAPHPVQGWDIHAFGILETDEGRQINPDFEALNAKLHGLVENTPSQHLIQRREVANAQSQSRGMSPATGQRPTPKMDGASFELDLDRVAFETLHLSYTQSDRALGLLKALGYSTIEFVTQTGDVDYDAVYAPIIHGEARLPMIVKLIEAKKTSILDPIPPPPGPPRPVAPVLPGAKPAVPDIGGKLLHQTTTGEALQRLLIVHDPEQPEALQKLKVLLNEHVDVASRQIVLEALVIEIDTDRMRDLGVSFNWQNGKRQASFGTDGSGNQLPLTFTFDRGMDFVRQFMFNLHALVSNGEAEILTNPSVLVLDGRQARIQIGQQIPVVSSTATNTSVSQRVDYFPVGIVLNIRPRLDAEAKEVTMQVETIVSSVAATGGAATSVGDDVFFAPAIDNRQVQSFVRIADNTPFIIGGLIAAEESRTVKGVPGLSKIPGLGSLFRRTSKTRAKREVIIVLTPHIMPEDEKSYGYAVPKESSAFDSFDNQLFRNAYRLRSQDIFDLDFLRHSPELARLVNSIEEKAMRRPEIRDQEPFAGLLAGRVPGEEVFVRRMLWEVIGEHDFEDLVDVENIIFFEPKQRFEEGFEVGLLRDALAKKDSDEWLQLSFAPLDHGTAYAQTSLVRLADGDYGAALRQGNPVPPRDGAPRLTTLLLGDRPGSTSTLDVLRRVLVLERVLELNPSLEMRLDALHVGLQIIFPSHEDLTRRAHLVDRETARLFFEVEEYYAAFESIFDREVAYAGEQLGDRP